jgi:hypothetical protein
VSWRIERNAIGLTAGLLLVCAALGEAIAADSRIVLLVIAGAFVLTIYLLVARRSSLPISFGLLLLLGGIAVPNAAGIVAAVTLAAVVGYSALTIRDRRAAVGLACLLVMGTWLALGLNPNIHNFHTALLGTRKTTLIFLGFGVGAIWPLNTRGQGESLILQLLIAAALICLAIHLGDPSYEQGLTRQAGEYTDLFAGKLRMEGIFAGPFHVAVLGTFLALRGWHQFLTRRYRQALPLIVLGAIVVLEADVRTAFITIALGVVLTLILRPPRRITTGGNVFKTLIAVAAVGLMIGTGVFGQNAAIRSISSLSENGRATHRLVSWSTAVQYFRQSPLYGLGPGSAGAALGGSEYGIVEHITSDNEFLAIIVEGGVIGAAIVLLTFFAIAASSDGLMSIANPSSAAVLSLFGFAFTGNVFETVPISVLLAVLIGLRVRPSPVERRSTVVTGSL